MNATLNTFPPFQSMGSPRGWILAVIVLLHLGFFYVLSSGLMPNIFPPAERRTEAFLLKPQPVIELPPMPSVVEPNTVPPPIYVPAPPDIPIPNDLEPSTAPRAPTTTEAAPPAPSSGSADPAPVVTQPEIDPKRALSEPMYPSHAIRAGWVGTVVLSVFVLENGRIGDVRLDQSSGYAELDNSALREARRWRLKPGSSDGIPTAMWKQIPITFQLREGSRF
jgi:periplasmic protein TonB